MGLERDEDIPPIGDHSGMPEHSGVADRGTSAGQREHVDHDLRDRGPSAGVSSGRTGLEHRREDAPHLGAHLPDEHRPDRRCELLDRTCRTGRQLLRSISIHHLLPEESRRVLRASGDVPLRPYRHRKRRASVCGGRPSGRDGEVLDDLTPLSMRFWIPIGRYPQDGIFLIGGYDDERASRVGAVEGVPESSPAKASRKLYDPLGGLLYESLYDVPRSARMELNWRNS